MTCTYPWLVSLRRGPALLLLAAPCFLAGCGLSDYEKQMASEVERLKAFDDDAEFLNGFIETPLVERLVEDKTGLKKEKALVPAFEGVNLFLRVPNGVNTKPDEKDNPIAGTFNTFRYSSKNNGSFREIRVSAAITENSKDFNKDLAQQNWNENFASQKTERKPYGREPLSFRTYEVPAPEGATLFVNIYVPDAVRKKQSDVRLAITFLVPKGKALPSTKKQMEACLGSVGLGTEAGQLKGEYDFQQRHKIQGPAPYGSPPK